MGSGASLKWGSSFRKRYSRGIQAEAGRARMEESIDRDQLEGGAELICAVEPALTRASSRNCICNPASSSSVS